MSTWLYNSYGSLYIVFVKQQLGFFVVNLVIQQLGHDLCLLSKVANFMLTTYKALKPIIYVDLVM